MLYAKPVPPGFWSLTIYDSATDLTVPNPINRYALGSDNDLKKYADGSIAMYLQHDNPGPDKESNWLPAPAGPFSPCVHAVATTPAQQLGLHSLTPPSCISLPRKGYRVGLRIGLFEACSAFTRVTACTLAPSPYIVTR